MRIRSLTFSCLAASLAMASLGHAASPAAAKSRPLLTITSPQARATLKGPSVRVEVQIRQNALRSSFRAALNGKDITSRFTSTGSCQKSVCTESASLAEIDGLTEGANVVRVRAKNGAGYSFHARTRFFWSASGSDGGVGDPTATAQPNYNFTTLTPGGYQGTPWLQVTSYALVGGGTRTYPANPTPCQNSVYLLVEIDRRSLREIGSTCLASAQVSAKLAAIPSTSFAVMGSISGINADWSNLNAGAIGGSDFRLIGDEEAPWGYMILGYGQSPVGVAMESYNTGYERSAAELAQLNGVLTVNAHGLYDFHPSDNAIVNVDGVNKRVEIEGVTYTPPAAASAPTGFWVLPITRRTLTPTAMPNQDNSSCPTNCGAVFLPNTPQDMIAMANYLGSVSRRSLIFVIAWGQQPGISVIDQVPDAQPYTLLNTYGIPINTYKLMTETNSVMAAVLSPDPTVPVRLPNRQALVSYTPSEIDQHGQLTAVLSRDLYHLYRPVSGVQNIFDPGLGYTTIDLSFLKTVWQPSSAWPMMDTPARVNAYQYLSYMISHKLWGAQQPLTTTNDIRGAYGIPWVNEDFATVDLTDSSIYPYPPNGTFTSPDNGMTYTFSQQDMTDVVQQLQTELLALDQVVNVFGTKGVNLRGKMLYDGAPLLELIRGTLNAALGAGGYTKGVLQFRLNDVSNWTASMSGITDALPANSGSWYGAVTGMIHAASSSGLIDQRGDGIPDYTATNSAITVANNIETYWMNNQDAYDSVIGMIVQDWNKLKAIARFSDPQRQKDYSDQLEKIYQMITLASRRYFYSVLLNGPYAIERYPAVTATRVSGIGTMAYSDAAKDKYCKALHSDIPGDSWVVLPSATAQPGLNDVYFIGGETNNNHTGFMTQGLVPQALMAPIFLVDNVTGLRGLPPELWFTMGPVSWRTDQYPSWYDEYDDSICIIP
ncbi:hypothetical protein [uncultured Paludibaculum sp.]|uniref:hypothetical protein n=1 Tax=uncultured Paludibaculum sp. TaxID=1765020 RepID=UPI002AAB16C2|nr:hypothetical protein [uncultured Paludibaculum sp.]